MVRLLIFCVCLLTGMVAVLGLELHDTRKDLAVMAKAYQSFLDRKAGGRPLSERIKPDSLAVFKSGQNIVGCAIVKGG